MVEELIGADVAGPQAFEWQRRLRHYWDPEAHCVEVALATSRHEYGYEYDGTGQVRPGRGRGWGGGGTRVELLGDLLLLRCSSSGRVRVALCAGVGSQDTVELVAPLAVPSLLAAVSALQASPIVTLARRERRRAGSRAGDAGQSGRAKPGVDAHSFKGARRSARPPPQRTAGWRW